MQHNLDFLKEGAMFPPETEALRLKYYYDNRKLFNGRTEEVFVYYLTRLLNNNILNDVDKAAFLTSLNYFKLLSRKTADLVCGEKPDVVLSETASDNTQKSLKAVVSVVNKKLRRAVIDFSRLGECVFRVYKKSDKPKITIINPSAWVPVVSEEDNDEVINHVIAYPENREGKRCIVVQVHHEGYYEERLYRTKEAEKITATFDGQSITFKAYQIGKLYREPKIIPTGLDDFAIIHVANEPTSDNIHGVSDYDDISSIVAEMEIRFAQIARILDKHAAPSVAADAENFNYVHDKDGVIMGSSLRMGDAFIISPNGGNVPQYIVWDAQLQAAYRQITELRKELDKITEMGAVISDNSENGGTQGFEALQVRMANARLKARRISEEFDDPYKSILRMLYKIKTGTILKDEFTVTWNDGIPNDTKRDAEVAGMLVDKGIKSRLSIRKEYYGLNEQAALKEQEQIDKEEPQQFELGFTGMNDAP